ncbi:MAG: metallophosphatase [Blastocatellia bacterium]|nr:metallophosphatase [Blastocatellia bacterium]
MSFNRRDFIKSLFSSAVIATTGSNIAEALVPNSEPQTITILHTNDTHSQIEPFAAGTRNAGLGGVARRATYVKAVRAENPNTLMVDAGDFFQGTPYFNFYRGEVEVKAMSAVGYDVITLGNHDFDIGVNSLVKALRFAKFDVVSANYDVSRSPLKRYVKSYTIKNLSGIRVGLFGLGINFDGLVVPQNHVGVKYLDPIESAKKMAAYLRKQRKVDLVVCLSHLGLKYEKEPSLPSDVNLAAAVPGIDLIVGGHTHSFMKQPEVVKHENGQQTLIFQVGYAGINVGRVDFTFSSKQLVSYSSNVITLGETA